MIRIDVPINGDPEKNGWESHFYGGGSIFSYTPTDFIDRHGYFGGRHKGEASEWSIRDGHVYADRSALRFEPDEPGKPKTFVHPAMDPSYDGKPSMVSETTWHRHEWAPSAQVFEFLGQLREGGLRDG